MARDYKLNDWKTLDPLIDADLAQGMTLDGIATKHGIGRSALGMHQHKRRKKQAGEATRPAKPAKPQEDPMTEDVVEVLPGQMTLTQETTPAEVHTSAVSEFETLPAGYAKTIQPMREYTEAEDAALKESVRLFGFIGAIVRDQYGRILDGNQRSRVARWFGKGCPYTITEVRDDAHALAVATSLNAVRRQYPREQREQIAIAMRDQGFSYRVIAEALGVSHGQARQDVIRHDTEAPVNHLTPDPVTSQQVETDFTPAHISSETPEPGRRVTGRDQKSYPAQRPTGTKTPTIGKGQAELTRERMGERGQPNSSWINVLSQAHRLCSSLKRQSDLEEIIKSWGPEGRQKAVSYPRPLYEDMQQLLLSLKAIDDQP